MRKNMLEIYANELSAMVDMEIVVKEAIESKAIVVIDEMDKLAKSVIVFL